jgi:hypothetical protein
LRQAEAADAPEIADMDARELHGEHREIVARAIDAKLERIRAAAAEPMALSDLALKAIEAAMARAEAD